MNSRIAIDGLCQRLQALLDLLQGGGSLLRLLQGLTLLLDNRLRLAQILLGSISSVGLQLDARRQAPPGQRSSQPGNDSQPRRPGQHLPLRRDHDSRSDSCAALSTGSDSDGTATPAGQR